MFVVPYPLGHNFIETRYYRTQSLIRSEKKVLLDKTLSHEETEIPHKSLFA